MKESLVILVVALVFESIPRPVGAVSFWPFHSKADKLVDQAESARRRGELHLATSLLDEAAGETSPPTARKLFAPVAGGGGNGASPAKIACGRALAARRRLARDLRT